MNPRTVILGVFSTVMVVSLVCSVSMQYGHADAPIAKTAEQIEPLQVGENAPRFIVETVNHEPFVFDPTNLERPVVAITFRGGWCSSVVTGQTCCTAA